jgi:hypothetical protein
LASFACFYLGRKNSDYNRLWLYSYGFYFAGLFHVAFLSTTVAMPSVLFLDQSWVLGLMAMLGQTAFMIVAHKNRSSFQNVDLQWPQGIESLNSAKVFVVRTEVKTLLYPLFAAVGFFLYWSFDKTLLSLLWVIECFVLFLISILMRESQFRMVSMVGIGLVFLRIVTYDLNGSDFLIKALVFIAVGLILIAMNTIYNKYKYRYESEQKQS